MGRVVSVVGVSCVGDVNRAWVVCEGTGRGLVRDGVGRRVMERMMGEWEEVGGGVSVAGGGEGWGWVV